MTGPANPSAKGQRDVLSPNVIRQWYDDGCIYQISAKRGSSFMALNVQASKIPAPDLMRAEWLSVYDPDSWEDDDENIYLSMWVKND